MFRFRLNFYNQSFEVYQAFRVRALYLNHLLFLPFATAQNEPQMPCFRALVNVTFLSKIINCLKRSASASDHSNACRSFKVIIVTNGQNSKLYTS